MAQIIIDKKTGIIEIRGGDFSDPDEAREKYGDDFYETEFTDEACKFKESPSMPTNREL